MNRSLYLILLLINSLLLLAYGGFLILFPDYIFNKLSQYAIFNWEEFAFSEGAVAYFLIQFVRLLGGLLTAFGLSGGLLLLFNWKQAQKGFWWLILPTHVLPYALIMAFAFFTARFGVIEMVGTLVLGLSTMAWWRLKGEQNENH